ncbi:phosphotransferase [Cytobacillus firmus]|uniref:phosphotransferase n=1 Tax=Cytobacillus firmus TaxID=1399 RepID=UPI001C9457D8|nr:phosphotransferase [Cytobacillus firmus]MBY6053953.1 aminoglycoside phosphotransferase family protein [Cytobacillus firmus]WHY63956.1 phosphotransferase [Cytobacillus firmus]
MFTNIVTANGTLNDRYILRREILYQGSNGRFVERFFIDETKSYIFKPLTNNTQLGKEVWIFENILAELPLKFPKILSYSVQNTLSNNWIILEDLGTITHTFDSVIAMELTALMAKWHSLPAERFFNTQLNGPKPAIEEMANHILQNKEKVFTIFRLHNVSERLGSNIFSAITGNPFSAAKVLCHGDLHQGNFGYAGGKTVVLDWEHCHLNIPYWDLFHLIDMSHPDFPKPDDSDEDYLRNKILDCYCEETQISVPDRVKFKREYYLFSAVFSVWMMLLIQSDLDNQSAKWTTEQLSRQLKETIRNLVECAEEII